MQFVIKSVYTRDKFHSLNLTIFHLAYFYNKSEFSFNKFACYKINEFETEILLLLFVFGLVLSIVHSLPMLINVHLFLLNIV